MTVCFLAISFAKTDRGVDYIQANEKHKALIKVFDVQFYYKNKENTCLDRGHFSDPVATFYKKTITRSISLCA